VNDYLTADGAALYHSTGVNQGRFGLLVYWLQEAINAITGNLDRRGGVLAGKQVIPRPPAPTCEAHSRIDGIPYVNSVIPAGIMADEILTPGKGQVRAMFNLAGNPLLTCAGSDRLAEAFSQLELFVCMDIVQNETAGYADYILPGLHGLERPDIPFYFFTVMGLMPERAFTYTDEVIAPPGAARDEALVFRQLCRKAKRPLSGSRPFQWASNVAEWMERRTGNRKKHSLEKWFYSLLVRSARIGGLGKLRTQPDGILLEPNRPGDYLGKRVATPNGRVQLAPADLLERAGKLDAIFEQELSHAGELKLIQKRERFSHNSWAHNVEEFIKGERNSNYLYMHPDDAEDRSLAGGDIARVSANAKAIELPVQIDSDMSPGSVAIPHGWGHQQADGLSVARHTTGVNVNVIMPDGPASIEPISGMSHMNGVIVRVERARGGRPPDAGHHVRTGSKSSL
jgi:anaerobic selenocysteine-containing dehydrogenase